MQGSRPKKLGEIGKSLQVSLLKICAGTLRELTDAFCRRTGLSIHHMIIRRRLEEMGIRHECAATLFARQDEPERRYRDPEQRYPSSFTDAVWRLIADLFEEEGQRGTPPRYPRRLLVDACCYVVRSGCSWSMLPRDFPPWQNVYRTFRRGSQ
ncbi:transposase [Modicisalibacter xianhensis]|uniref:transposase n=1 Tax=Modicisalibacter xianhensis TaxID=442341 RepID=UPI003BF48380